MVSSNIAPKTLPSGTLINYYPSSIANGIVDKVIAIGNNENARKIGLHQIVSSYGADGKVKQISMTFLKKIPGFPIPMG